MFSLKSELKGGADEVEFDGSLATITFISHNTILDPTKTPILFIFK